ncbi:anti-sigma factor [Parerythrobacter aestuarii]|uniref:anti-sigma factor n=1 Tax=Parerythrobacter aestuarii TaxID=3020909 RepID=UPI0024DE820A|nr:anti-sigma factor [Parerythrobacter aestuarii]
MADTIALPEDDFLLAGEQSLGVLEGNDGATARRRQLAEPEFAAAVAWWDDRLARMAEAGGSMVPSADVLRGIHAALDKLGDGTVAFEPSTGGPSRWSVAWAALGTAMAAAALVLYVATPGGTGVTPPIEDAAPTPQLVAQLQDENAGRRLASVIDPDARRLALRLEGLDPEVGQIAELWVIPADGVPRSLGEIPGSGTFQRELSDVEAGLLVAGSALAVTFERDEGIRHEAPSPPILLVGVLDEV